MFEVEKKYKVKDLFSFGKNCQKNIELDRIYVKNRI